MFLLYNDICEFYSDDKNKYAMTSAITERILYYGRETTLPFY